MSEQWRAVPGYEGSYEVSDLGRVRSIDRYILYPDGRTQWTRGRVLKTVLNHRHGRNQVYLWRDNKQRTCRVYQLVMLAFVGPCPAGYEVAHNNGISTDDRLSNLRYATKSENNYDQVRHGTHPEASRTHCGNGHPWDEANTYWYHGGRTRLCKACRRDYARRYYHAKRAQLALT